MPAQRSPRQRLVADVGVVLVGSCTDLATLLGLTPVRSQWQWRGGGWHV